jgi:hypothetical protein
LIIDSSPIDQVKMNSDTFDVGERFMRQLLLHRYATLLKKIEETYPLTDAQKQALQEKILTIDWIDPALS